MTSVELDPASGKALRTTIGTPESEFPSIEPADVGRRYANLLCLVRGPSRRPDLPGFEQVALIDVESGDRQRFSYGDDRLAEEHLLVREHREARARWIAGTALAVGKGQTVLSVFAADALGDGPVAQARLQYALPLGLHGTFRAQPADL